MPAEWRLLWVADSCEVNPIPLPPQATCQEDVAELASVSGPASAAEIAANLITARFCSAGSEPASTALFVLDLPGGRKGGFKVVALDPADPDSTRVVQSPVVTFNGGVETPFHP